MAEEGLNPRALPRARAPGIRDTVAPVPAGGPTMRLENRIALLEWARRTGSVVVGDDFRYQGSPLIALAALDRALGEGKAFRAGSKKLGVRAERPSAPRHLITSSRAV